MTQIFSKGFARKFFRVFESFFRAIRSENAENACAATVFDVFKTSKLFFEKRVDKWVNW